MLPVGPLATLLGRLHEWEGELHIHEGGRTHRLLIRQGRPVAARVVGHFDPLLTRLRREGALNAEGWDRALTELSRTERRSGDIAKSQGVRSEEITRALDSQLRDALRHLSRRMGTQFQVERVPRTVTAGEVVAWLPRVASPVAQLRKGFASKSRTVRGPRTSSVSRRLRDLAAALHPDRLQHLPPSERRQREANLAELNAQAQGL